MAIITISRGSYSKGKEIAERVAQELGCDCISREVLLEASEHFNVPEAKLVRALHDAPSFFDRFTYGREKYLAYIQAELLVHAVRDNLVYHGLAGHFILGKLRHALHVRILADIEDRVRLEMEREGISKEKALKVLQKDDEERRKWSRYLFGKDPWDPRLYDLVLHIDKFTVEDAVKMICQTALLEQFRTTPQSRKEAEEMLLAAQARVALVTAFPAASVSSHDGVVFVDLEAPVTHEPAIIEEIKQLLAKVPGVNEVRVHVIPLRPDMGGVGNGERQLTI